MTMVGTMIDRFERTYRDAGTMSLYTGYTVYDAQSRKVTYTSQDGPESSELSLAPGNHLVQLDRPAGHTPMF